MSTLAAANPWPGFTNRWTKLARSVIRPNPAEVQTYEELSGLNRSPRGTLRVAILGATPELREAFGRHEDVNLVVIDKFPESVEALTSLMDAPDSREIWHQVDWLEMRPGGLFDVVLADMALSNLPYGNPQEQLLRLVSGLLASGGVFVTRVESIKPSHRRLSLDEFFARFDGLEADDSTIARFWDTAWITGDLDRPGIHVRPVYEAIVRHAKTTGHPAVNRILDRGGVLFPLEMSWSTHREPELLRLLETSFRIDAQRHDPGLHPDVRDFPRIYRLVKKGAHHDRRL